MHSADRLVGSRMMYRQRSRHGSNSPSHPTNAKHRRSPGQLSEHLRTSSHRQKVACLSRSFAKCHRRQRHAERVWNGPAAIRRVLPPQADCACEVRSLVAACAWCSPTRTARHDRQNHCDHHVGRERTCRRSCRGRVEAVVYLNSEACQLRRWGSQRRRPQRKWFGSTGQNLLFPNCLRGLVSGHEHARTVKIHRSLHDHFE